MRVVEIDTQTSDRKTKQESSLTSTIFKMDESTFDLHSEKRSALSPCTNRVVDFFSAVGLLIVETMNILSCVYSPSTMTKEFQHMNPVDATACDVIE